MKRQIAYIIDEYHKVMGGYVGLYAYQLVNLCIKSDPVSLLGVTVDIEDETMNIEDVAVVAAGDNEYEIRVVPKDEDNLMLIGKGIAEEHIEFKQEIATITLDGETECRYIKLTMPEVNEDRKKLLTDSVKALHDGCVAKLKATTAAYTAKITANIIGAPKEEVEEVEAKMKEATEMYNKGCEDVTTAKNDEINEAYSLFLQKNQQQQTEQAEQDAATGKDMVSHLKLQ